MRVGVGRVGGDEEIDRRRSPCPGAAAGRRRAGRWCPARPRRSGRSRRSTGEPSTAHALAVALHLQLLEIGGEARRAADRRESPPATAWPSTLRFQTDSSPISTGMLSLERRRAEMAVDVDSRRCRNSSKCSGADRRSRAAGRCSTRSNSVRRPNPRSRTRARPRCRIRRPCRAGSRRRRNGRPTAPSPSASTIQARADRALVIVSWVVKVFEETMNRVARGRGRASVSAMSAPSTLETKCARRPAGA